MKNKEVVYQRFNYLIVQWHLELSFTAIALGFAQGIKSIIGYNYGAKIFTDVSNLLIWLNYYWKLIIFVLLLFIGLGPQLLMTFAFPSSLVDQYRWTSVLMLMSYPCAAISLWVLRYFRGWIMSERQRCVLHFEHLLYYQSWC